MLFLFPGSVIAISHDLLQDQDSLMVAAADTQIFNSRIANVIQKLN
jgi:hypothetical protein